MHIHILPNNVFPDDVQDIFRSMGQPGRVDVKLVDKLPQSVYFIYPAGIRQGLPFFLDHFCLLSEWSDDPVLMKLMRQPSGDVSTTY